MNDDKLDRVLEKVEPQRRAILQKLLLGAGFAVPIIASFSVKDLAQAAPGSLGTVFVTSLTTLTRVTDTFTFVTVTVTPP